MPTTGSERKSNVLSLMVGCASHVEFVTKVTIMVCVKYFFLGKVSRINAKNYPLCVICLIQAKDVAAFHKITGELVGIPVETSDNLFKHMSKTSSILKFLLDMVRFIGFFCVKF